MVLPSAVFATLQAERARYGPQPTAVELGQLLNATAYAHRAESFGLSRKDSGAHAPMPGGEPPFIAHDILMLPDGTAWDCLLAAGEQATPVQTESFRITDPERGWVAPVAPGGGDDDEVPDDLADRVAALEARLAALEAAAVKAGDRITLRADSQYYVCAEPDGRMLADRPEVGPWEQFTVGR